MTILRVLRLAERSLLVLILLSMVALFFLGVVTREVGGVFASRFAWIEEATRILNIFLVFLALGLALERGKQVSIDTLQNRLPPAALRVLCAVIDTVGLVFSVYMSWLGLQLVAFVLKTGQTSPTLGLPMGWVYMAPVIGFALLALRYGLRLAGVITRHQTGGA
ncbi:TRAP transporter small permease [Tropicimonas sp. IMCC34043]|uniref:TRAP transporter small permease n=1 Tax=Tropicimonas sp. IMCC34043 TaxID=2248760 RepID=UPI000E21F9FF|nr:TRAP transporter small permease [Tropicimonas sp. IMCC34043]